MAKLPSEDVLSKNQLYAIGCVAVESSRLDQTIETWIWIICGLDEDTGRLFTDRAQLDGKIGMLRDLVKARIKGASARAAFKRITDDLAMAVPRRNTVIHGEWLSEPEPLKRLPARSNYPVAIRMKRDQKNIPPVHATEVMAIAKNLAHLHARLQMFCFEHWGELDPSRRRRP